jgi:type I restriction enzyme S subunit
LRATELGVNNQIDWQSCLRAPIEFSRHERARLKIGDVLVAVKGATIASEKSVCTVSRLDEPTIINGSIFRFQPSDETTSDFLLEALTSGFVKKQMKGSLILNNAVDYLSRTILDNLLLPLPNAKTQDDLVLEMKAARKRQWEKLEKADRLVAGLDAYLLDQLGLTPPPEDNRKVFAVRLEQLRGKRIDAPAYQPFYAKGHPPKTPTKPLSKIADIDRNTAPKPATETELVPYIGLPECELTEVREVVMRPYSEVRGRSVVKQGDILFARIEPSVFNKKYVLADDLKGQNYAYTSTEFYVVRAKDNEVLQEYLYALFFCSFVFAQVKGKTTGSSGRRRIDPDLFSLLQIPVPDPDLQKAVAAEVSHRRAEARRLRAEAAAEWTAAKARFEQQLLGAGKQ